MNFEFHPISKENWSDFETLMESRGAPHNCWCTAWIDVEKKGKLAKKPEKKATMKKRVAENTPVGILVYVGKEPIGWIAVAPRETYKSLGGDDTKEQVWSVVCFFIKRAFRGRGISHLLLQQAIEYASIHGAKYIEGYPVAPDSPSYRFMGFIPMFESADFEFVKTAGKRRKVMLRNFDCEPNMALKD